MTPSRRAPGRLASVGLAGTLAACASSGGGGMDAGADRRAGEVDAGTTPTCPLAPPTPGQPCPAALECSFGDPCSLDRYDCQDGTWIAVLQDAAARQACPEVAPLTGSTCASCGSSFRCVYTARCQDGETMTTTSICSGGHWLTGAGACDGAAPVDGAGEPG